MSLLSKSALVALLLAGTVGAANAQATRQIQVLPAEQAVTAQVVQAPAADANAQVEVKAPAVAEAAPAPEAKPVIVEKKVVRFAHPQVQAPYHGYASQYGHAPRYSDHCNRGYRGGYRGY